MDFLGTKLATCSCDKTIRLFDMNVTTGAQTFIAQLKGHEGPVFLLDIYSRVLCCILLIIDWLTF